jgi:pimeloyl-ACP methyl ester carboxylesterase
VRPRLLIVPAWTEAQWTIRPRLEQWAEVASFDPPGVGSEPLPPGLELDPELPEAERRAAFRDWRRATAARGLEEVDRLGWKRFFVVVDGEGARSAVLLATARPEAIEGIAIGHAALARTTEGDRPTMSKEVWRPWARCCGPTAAGSSATGSRR